MNEDKENKLAKEVLDEVRKTRPVRKVVDKFNKYAKYCFNAREYDEEKFGEVEDVAKDYALYSKAGKYRDWVFEEYLKYYPAFSRFEDKRK